MEKTVVTVHLVSDHENKELVALTNCLHDKNVKIEKSFNVLFEEKPRCFFIPITEVLLLTADEIKERIVVERDIW